MASHSFIENNRRDMVFPLRDHFTIENGLPCSCFNGEQYTDLFNAIEIGIIKFVQKASAFTVAIPHSGVKIG